MKPIRFFLAAILICFITLTSHAQYTNGLIAYYQFNGNANDVSGMGNNGTALNGVSYVTNEFGTAAVFNGSSQYVSLPNTITNYQDLSVTFWVKTGDFDPNAFPFGEFLVSRDISGFDLDWNICLEQGRKINFVTDGDELIAPEDLNSNIWVQVGCVADSSNQVKTLFVNGKEVASASWLPNPFANNNVPIFLGASTVDTGSHAFYSGEMSDVRIYNRALATNEVQAIYNVEKPDLCTPPSGIVGWWKGENNSLDSVGTNNGTLIGNVTYTNGEVGQAFSFNALGDQVSIPTSGFPVSTNDRTLECWFYINSFIPGEGALFAFYGTTAIGGSYSLGAYSDQRVYFSQWGSIIFGPVLTTGQWYHVAVTSEGNNTTLYLNGTNVASGNLPFNTPADSQLLIGSINNEFANYQMIGSIDEVSIYNRALSQSEIQAIYNAGSAGKCISPVPPQILTQPANQTVFLGQIASFNVLASGTPPFSYQWNFNSNNIVGATNATLNLSNILFTSAGNYTVLVSNGLGSILSSNAILTVNPPPPCAPPPSGLVSWWKGDGNTLDSVGTNNGSLIGNVTYTNGEVGQAFSFNALGDQVTASTGGFPVGTSDRTIECWVYINSFAPGLGANFAFYGTTDLGGAYNIGIYTDQRLFFSQWGLVVEGPIMATGQWYHVAVTSAGGVSTLYLNGTNVASGNIAFNTPAGSQLLIGGINYQFANDQTIGLIDELSIYNRALSQGEIQGIYNAGSQGKCYIPLPRPATANAQWAGLFVVGVNIVDGGAVYTNTPSVRFIGGGGTNAQASVVVSNGVVIAINITNPGFGYTNAPVVVIDPPFISNPILGIASVSVLNFSNLLVGTNYQLQQFLDPQWVNQSIVFQATNNFYTKMVSGGATSDNYRLAQVPVPVQATASAQLVNGFVVSVFVNNQGSGYTTVPAVTIIDNVGSNATAVASISNGKVTSIAVINAGSHYLNPLVQIDPPPATALSPTVISGVTLSASSLAPYDNYQIQFKPEINTVWGNLNGGLFSPISTINSQYIFLTNNTGYFRLQYVP